MRNAEQELERAKVNKAEAEKRTAEIKERMDKIDAKTEKWEALLSSEGLKKKPTPEAAPIISGGGSAPEPSIGSEPKEEKPATGAADKPATDGSALGNILEGISETVTGGAASGGSAGGAPERGPARSGERQEGDEGEEGLEERFKKAKSLGEIAAIIGSMDDKHNLFEKGGKSLLMWDIGSIEQSGNLDILDSIPETYGLRSKVRETLDKGESPSTTEEGEKPEIENLDMGGISPEAFKSGFEDGRGSEEETSPE